MTRKHWIWLGCGTAGLVCLVLAVSALLARSREKNDTGDAYIPPEDSSRYTVPIEDFTLSSPDGDLALYDCTDTPVVLRFFTPGEEDLPKELALMEELSAQYEGAVLFLPVCAPEDRERSAALFRQNGIGLCLYTDTTGKAKEACAVTQTPSTVFIDAAGFHAAKSKGAIDEETLRFGVSMIAPKG